MWNEKFNREDHLYGTEPNDFLRAKSASIPRGGRVVSLGEGEGRNAVFLAQQGFQVTAIDSSSVGLEKTKKFAAKRGVIVDTILGDLTDCDLGEAAWDGVIMIFCHLPSSNRPALWTQIARALKPNGVFLAELYNPLQLEATKAGRSIGGPKDLDLLLTKGEIAKSFPHGKFELLEDVERQISEGSGHQGLSHTVQAIWRRL